MRRKIPPTELLLAFEAAARHQSFTRAAEELSLTQSAVCRQIGALEAFLGLQLFNRVKKRVSLSEAGAAYALKVRDLLGRLENETLSVMAHQGAGGVLELAVIPTFATRWLIPRLSHFNARHGDITLNLKTRAEPFMFTDTPFDAAIHFGEPIWAGAITEFLFGEEMVPVCTPAMLGGARTMTAEELETKPLLHHSARPDAWPEWFEEAGLPNVSAIRGPRYELFSMLVEAARAGLGVALVPRFFVLTEVNSGELVIPHRCFTRSKRAYYLVYPEDKAQSASLETFRSWLKEQAAAYIRDREGYHSHPL